MNPKPSNPIIQILISRDGMSLAEALDQVREAKADWIASGSDPYDLEQILEEEFGLEPDFIFDLADLFGMRIQPMTKIAFPKEFSDLCSRVAALDPEAADWLRTKAPNLPSFSSRATNLWGVMIWMDTPQGPVFWHELARRMDRGEA